MIWIVSGLVFICVISFFVVMIFWPEWVGISGKDHARIEAEHRGDPIVNQAKDDTKNA